MACTPLDPAYPIAERLATYLDCHSEVLGHDGFSHLSGSGLGQMVLTSALTIYVALIGYRLMLGQAFGFRAAIWAALRVGAVLALATSWSAYDTLVYRLVTDGPAELASQILPSDLGPVSLRDAARRVDLDLASLQGAITQSVAATSAGGAPSSNAGVSTGGQTSQSTVAPMLDFPGAVLLISTIGSLAALRVAAGVLLGFGPVFIMFALFDSTLGAFEGWARGLLTVFLGGAGAIAVTTLELHFIESDLIASLSGGPGVNSTSSLLATTVLFATVMLTVLVLAVAVGRALRLPRRGLLVGAQADPAPAIRHKALSELQVTPANLEPASRAQEVADAVLRLSRREGALYTNGGASLLSPLLRFGRVPQDLRTTASPNGQAMRRRSAPSSLASAKRRDGL